MKVFRNRHGEIRSGYKIISMLIMVLVCQILLGICLRLFTSGSMVLNSMGNIGYMLANLISEFVMIFIAIVFWRVLENKPISEMGIINIKKGYKEFIYGLVLGAVTISIVAIVLISFKQAEIKYTATGKETIITLIASLVTYIFVGFAEEIICRGYIMSILKRTRNKYAVIIISALIFAAMHLANPGITLLAFLNLSLVGALFAYMFMKSKNIWMCIGYHITWNYFQGAIWGFSVSGTGEKGICSLNNLGNNFINGGSFGPEGGIAVTIIICLAFVFVYKYYRNKDINEFMNIC